MTTSDGDLRTIAIVALGALLILPLLFAGFGMMGSGMMGFGPMMGGMWGTGMHAGGSSVPGWLPLVGTLIQLLYLAAIVGVGYLAYRHFAGAAGSDPAVEELRLAYARGDLTEEEYEQRRKTLQNDR